MTSASWVLWSFACPADVPVLLDLYVRQGKKWGGFGRNLMCLAFLMAQIVVLGFMADYLINHRS